MDRQLTRNAEKWIRLLSNLLFLLAAAFAGLAYCGYRFANGVTIMGYSPMGVWFWEVFVFDILKFLCALGAFIIMMSIHLYLNLWFKMSPNQTGPYMFSGQKQFLWCLPAIILFEIIVLNCSP